MGDRRIFIPQDTGLTNTNNFAPVTYTGNGSTQSISSLDFQPDLVWTKQRNGTGFHLLIDSVRGNTKEIYSNSTSAEGTSSNTITSFDSNGYSIGNNGALNGSNNDYVAWCWKGGGSAVSNTDGTITSSVSANPDAGFSIVSYTGNGGNSTVGHGLNSAPELIIIKRYETTGNWPVYYPNGETQAFFLNLTQAPYASSTMFNNTAPTNSVFHLGTNGEANQDGTDTIAYCFHSVDGYQKVGSYTGDGTTSNSITTGFEPRFLMIKVTSGSDNWVIFDNARDTSNPRNTNLKPNSSSNEVDEAGSQVNFTSTGFTCVGSGAGLGQVNSDEATYIYLAIA